MLRRFGEAAELERDEIESAAVRVPRPSRLQRPLVVSGAKAKAGAEALGLTTVGRLLAHLPRDQRESRPLAELGRGESATAVVEVRAISARAVRRRGMKPIVEAVVADGSASVSVAFFNQPWLLARYPPGTRLLLHLKRDERGRYSVVSHAPTGEAVGGGDAVAHYPASEGISSTQILALVHEHTAAFAELAEPLPARLRTVERLPDRPAALRAAHFAGGGPEAELSRRRLAFDELLLVQLALIRRRRMRRLSAAAPPLDGPRELTARWLAELLPFELTRDQALALEEIDRDLALAVPMQRLLMGEVGSGKTVVALYALLRAMEQGYQGALMAPTETLAEQHFRTIASLLPGELVSAGLLTGSTPASRRADLLSKLATGELSLVVGTHALIEDAVRFARLGVAVVDEQHRFGVRQRSALDAKGAGTMPHVLHMTATPIPRTLALTGYGDLDFTVLRELPQGRRPIATFVCSTEGERARAYERIREELRAGRQGFVVCPLVVESEVLEARAATAEFERLRAGELRDFRCVLMHGQMSTGDKQAAMAAFAAGAAEVMVATSVIEVGIDVPNATVMLVEDAERYGISQLHQLRGRIGRGAHDSLCLLFGARESARLRALAEHSDGFALAEIDLQLRGEGELIGLRQHGTAELRVAEMPRDAELLERARLHARRIDDDDPELEAPEHLLLAVALGEAFGAEAAAPMRA